MFKFDFADLTSDGLRKLADHYGISRSVTAREPLVAALNERMSAGTEVVLMKAPGRWYRSPAVLGSIITTVVAVCALGVNWFTIQYTVGKDVQQRQDAKKSRWQEVIVYKIIEENTKSGDRVIGLDDIRAKYLNEANAAESFTFKKEELQPWALRYILFDLIAGQMVYQTLDDKYAIQRQAIDTRVDRVQLEDQAKYAILNTLSREGGKHNISELGQIIVDRYKISNEEYNTLMNQLMAANMVFVGVDMKLYSITSVPRTKP